VALAGTLVITSLLAAAALTVIEELGVLAARVSPLVREAVRVIDCAFVCSTAQTAEELSPDTIVSLLPLDVPVPDAANDTPLSALTGEGFPTVSSTLFPYTTLFRSVALAGTLVITSLLAAAAFTVIEELGALAARVSPLVRAAVRVIDCAFV